MPHYPDEIEYSDKYMDDAYEYRHVILSKQIYKQIPRNRLLSENVYKNIISGMEVIWSSTITRMGSL